MRILRGGIAHVACVIEDDLKDWKTGLTKPQIATLSDLAACALSCRKANSGKWLSILPRKCDETSKERHMSRFFSHGLIDPISVMGGFIPEIIQMLAQGGKTVILMLDQSKISTEFECLMVSLRAGERAIPVAWRVVQTKGPIGYEIQKELLDRVKEMISPETSIMLAADRFYGTSALISWCQKAHWQYRIRLKLTLVPDHEAGEITTGEAAKKKIAGLEKARFHQTQIVTHSGILHEPGHAEPWIIAMDCTPSKYKVLHYGLRWGIECMFSDFKSRGFSITKTHLMHADRIERLIFVLTLALYWAVSTGMQPKAQTRVTKKSPKIVSFVI